MPPPSPPPPPPPSPPPPLPPPPSSPPLSPLRPSPPPPSPPPVFTLPDTVGVVEEAAKTFSYTIAADGALPATLRLQLQGYSSEQLQFIKVGGLTPPGGASTVEVSMTDPAGLTVVIGAVDDTLVEGVHSGVVDHSWVHGNDTAVSLGSVQVTIIDNDEKSAGLKLVPDTVIVMNEGTSTSFGITLNARADQEVVVSIPQLDNPRLSLTPRLLVFNSSTDLSVPQRIDVVAAADEIVTGDVTFQIELVSSSLTAAYSGLVANVTITVVDMDTPGIVTNQKSLVVDEAVTARLPQLEVTLASTPTAPVTILLQDESGQLQLSVLTLTFNPGQAPGTRLVTVNAVKDLVAEPTKDVVLKLVTVSEDPVYSQVSASVNVRVLDDDTPGVIVNALPQVVPERDTLLLSVTLSSVPQERVVVTLSSTPVGGGVHGLPETSVTFQAADWISRNNNKTIQHVVQHDKTVTGDFPMPILVTVGGTDPTYLALGPVPDVQVTIKDIDLPRLCIESCSLDKGVGAYVLSVSAQEGGASVPLPLVLSTRPSADVKLDIISYNSSQVEAEGSLGSWPTMTIPLEQYGTGADFGVAAIDDQMPEADHITELCVASSSEDPFYHGLQRCALLNIKDSILVKVASPVTAMGGTLTGFTGVKVAIPPGAISVSAPSEPVVLEQVDPDFQRCPMDPSRYEPVSMYSLSTESGGSVEFQDEVAVSIPLPGYLSLEQDDDDPGAANFHMTFLNEETCEWEVAPVPTIKEGGTAVITTQSLPTTWGLTLVKPLITFVAPENPKKVVFTETDEPVILDLAPELQSLQQDLAEALTLRVISATIDPSTFEPGEDILLAGDMDHEQYYIDATRLSDAEAILKQTQSGSRRKLAHDGDGVHDWSKWDLDWDQASGTLTMTSIGGPASYNEASELVKTVSYFNPKRGISHELNRYVKLQLFEEYSATPRVSWVEVDVRPIPTPPEVLTTKYPVRCIERAGFVAIDENITLYDVDSPNLLSGWLTIEPSVEGDIVEYNETEGLTIAKTGSGQWQASGVEPLATYQEFFRSFRIKNDGPTVRDSIGGFMRRAWFFVDEGSQAWGFRDIEMVPVNDPPIITAPMTISVMEEGNKHGFLQAYDPEGEEVTYRTGCAPQKGTLEVDLKTGAYIYRPYPDAHGSDKFVFVASDPQGLTDVQTVEITIMNLPDPPKAEDLIITVWMGLNNTIVLPIIHPDGAEIKTYITREPEQPGHALYLQDEFRSQPGSSRRGGNNPVVYYPPLRAVSGYTDSFQFAAVAMESREVSEIRTCTLIVQNPGVMNNQPPVPENITVNVRSGNLATGDLVATDDLTSADQLVYEVLGKTKLGWITHSSGANSTRFSYRSYPGVHGSETVAYSVTDIFGLTGTAFLNIVVEEFNSPPIPACMDASPLFYKGLERVLLGKAGDLVQEGSKGEVSEEAISELYFAMLDKELSFSPSSDVRSATLRGMNEVLNSTIIEVGTGNGAQVLCEFTSTITLDMTMDVQSRKENSMYLFAYDVDEEAPLVYNISSTPKHGSIGFVVGESDTMMSSRAIGHPAVLYYSPEPLRRGFPMDSFQWTATDVQGLKSEPITVNVQVACAPGYMIADNETKCRPCPAGSFNLPDRLDQTQCYDCPLGSSAPLPGSTECSMCPADTFADSPGMADCSPCPDDAMTSPPGSTTPEACLCLPGYFVNFDVLDPEICMPCPPDSTVCDEPHQLIPKPASDEWWVAPEDGKVLPCIPRRDSCVQHETVEATLSGECQEGYTGYGCRYCDAGFYRSYTTFCNECSKYTWLLYFLSIMGLILAVPLLTYFSRLHIWGPINIVAAYLQTNAMLVSMDLGWPRALKILYALITVIVVKFELFSPQCFVPKSAYLLKLIVINLLPAILLMFFIPYIYYRRWRAARDPHPKAERPQWCNGPLAGFLALLSVAYMTIVDVNLEYWNCEYSHDGKYFMVASPNIQCWNYSEPNLHTELRSFVIAAMIVYVAGIPLLFAGLFFGHRKTLANRNQLEVILLYGEGNSENSSSYKDLWLKVQAGGDDALKSLTRAKSHFGFLFRRYDQRCFWWELIVLLKKLSIALVHHQLPPGSIEQGAAAVLVIVTYGLSVVRFQPYDATHMDAMDYVAEVMSMLLAVSGLAFFADVLPSSEENALAAILVILSLVSFGIMAAFVAVDVFPRIRQRLRVWRIERSVDKLKIKRDMQERKSRRRAKWRSVVKRVSTQDLKRLVEAAAETKRVEEAQEAMASWRGVSSTRGARPSSNELLNYGIIEDPALPMRRRTQNWVHGMDGEDLDDQGMEITAKIDQGMELTAKGSASVQRSSAEVIPSRPLKSMKPAAAAAWFGAPLHDNDLGGASLTVVGRFMRPLWKQKIKADLEADEQEKAVTPSRPPVKSMKPAAAAAWFGAPLHDKDLGGASLTVVGRFMRPLWKQKIKADLEADEQQKARSSVTSEDGLVSFQAPRSTGDGKAWRRIKKAVAISGTSPRRTAIIKLFAVVLTREALELVKAWVTRKDLDDDDLKCAEELGRTLFKHWRLKRAARMAPRRTDKNTMALIDESHAADNDDTHDLFHEYDNTCFKAQDYLAFEANDVTRSLILAAMHQAKEAKRNSSKGFDYDPPDTSTMVMPVDDAEVGQEPPSEDRDVEA